MFIIDEFILLTINLQLGFMIGTLIVTIFIHSSYQLKRISAINNSIIYWTQVVFALILSFILFFGHLYYVDGKDLKRMLDNETISQDVIDLLALNIVNDKINSLNYLRLSDFVTSSKNEILKKNADSLIEFIEIGFVE